MSRLLTPVGCRCAFNGVPAKEACGELEQSCRRCCLDITSTPAILVTPAAGQSWRITEKAPPPPQPSKRASLFKGTLEQARLAGLTDEEIANIAAALTPVLAKEERSGDTGRSVKRGVLPEACRSQTTK